MAVYRYRGWVISHKGCEFTAHKNGFFTSYHTCDTTGEFLDILNDIYGAI